MDELQSTADVNYLQKNVFLRRLLLVESHWGRLLLCVEGIFWLIWLFQHVMNVSIVLPIWWNYILRISSVISITGTFCTYTLQSICYGIKEKTFYSV